MIAFRKAHPVISSASYDFDHNGTGYPEMSFHGTKPWELDRSAPGLCFSYLFAEDHKKYGTKKDAFIYVLVNSHWEEHTFELPIIPEGHSWKKAFDSTGFSSESGKEKKLSDQSSINLAPRSTVILVG